MNKMTPLKIFAVASIISLPLATQAQIKTDGSLGRPAQTLSGPDFVVPQSLGKLSGGNLFHSFQTFNINSGESATFTTASTGINNVISRVTGGSNSLINGPLSLKAASGTPNFYFINPAGVIFGAGASIDVPGAFHVSTADYLKFPDGNFYAGTTSVSTFSSVEPIAFGFLGTSRASILVKDGAVLSTKPLQPISVLGGDVEINLGRVESIDGGDIRVLALGQKRQEVSLFGALPKILDGTLLLASGTIRSHGDTIRAGSVKIAAGSLMIDGNRSEIYSLDFMGSIGKAGVVDVSVTDNLSVNGGRIFSATHSSGNASSVNVSAGSLTIDRSGGELASGIFGFSLLGSTGDAGSVDVVVRDHLTLKNGGKISSLTSSSGRSGLVKVSAGSLTVDGRGLATGILSDAISGSTGNTGDVNVAVTDHLILKSGGRISSLTNSSGNSGLVRVSAGSLTIDGGGSELLTGILSEADEGSTGNAGSVDVAVAGLINIQSGLIRANTNSSGNAGSVTVNSGSLIIDGSGSDFATGISSVSTLGSTGNAGSLGVVVAGQLSIQNRGHISSDTQSSGNAGSVKVSAGSLTIDGSGSEFGARISSDAIIGSTGTAGSVDVTAIDRLIIKSGGFISSNTHSSGNAGSVKVSAGSLTIDGNGSEFATGILSVANPDSSGNAGNVGVEVASHLSIQNGGQISSGTFASGGAGSVKVSSGSLTTDGGGSESATGIASDAISGTGDAGNLDVAILEHLTIKSGGIISSSTYSSGNASSVKVSAGSLLIDGSESNSTTGIASTAVRGSTGDAGSVSTKVVRQLSIKSGGVISTSTFGSGNSGSVEVSAGTLIIDGSGSDFLSGIVSTANPDSTGDAGVVSVMVTDHLTIKHEGMISSATYSSGNSGSVTVSAGSLTIDGDGSAFATGISSEANPDSTGNAGSVGVVVASQLSIQSSGVISSSTFASGNAGAVKVSSKSLTIDGRGSEFGAGITSDANTDSTGNAGSVDVATVDLLVIKGNGTISSNTNSFGNAGSVKVSAGSLTIDGSGGEFVTGILSDAITESTGNAGRVGVAVEGQLSIQNGGWISSSTLGSGKGGSIDIQATTIDVSGRSSNGRTSGIRASAEVGSSGQTGNVSLTSKDNIRLAEGGMVSIRNVATVSAPEALVPTALTVSAMRIELLNGDISAASTGNVSASNVSLNVADQLSLENGRITTSANTGNGGSILIRGGNLLNLERSQITTSVLGLTGNGGDINISAKALVMNSGFIQANTAATSAIGGNVQVNVDTLLPSGNTLFVGGQTAYRFMPEVFGFNVIQAAAPTGISGAINVMAPVLDISGSLNGLSAKLIDGGKLGRNPCQATGGSSLAVAGRGGSAESARGWLGSELSPIEFLPGGANVKESTRKMSVNETGCRHL